MSDQRSPHEGSRPDAFPLVDATSGDFYDLGGDFVGRFAVLSQLDEETDQPFSRLEDAARFDPRSLRYHELKGKKTPAGAPDRRFTFQIYNDREGEYADAEDGAAPFQREAFTSLNRSTREVDGQGRTALPCSQRWVVDSEDGRFALALAISELQIPEATASQPLDPADDAGGGLPPGVAFSAAGDAVSIVSSGGAVTFRGAAAVQAARDAVAKGGAAIDVARAASHAARGLAPPPDNLWTGTRDPGGTRLRPPAPETNPTGLRSARGRPTGYVTDGSQHGLWDTLITLDGNRERHYFRGSEGTPIGRTAIRADAHFSQGSGRSGPLRIVSNDAAPIDRTTGGKPYKGELWWDTSLANQDTAVGFEDGKLVPVIFVDAAIPPSGPPPIIIGVDPDEDDKDTTQPRGPGPGPGGGPTGAGGAAGGGAAGGGAAGGGAGGIGHIGQDPTQQPRQPGRPQGGAGSSSLPQVGGNPASQARDFSGPGEPCPNLTSGRSLGTLGRGGGPPIEVTRVPGVTSVRGQVVDTLGYPGLTPAGPGQLAVGGIETLPASRGPRKDDRTGVTGLPPPDAPTPPIDSTGFDGGVTFGIPGGSAGGFGFTPDPNGDRGIPGKTDAEARAANEARRQAREDARRRAEDEEVDRLKQEEEGARDEAQRAGESGDDAGNRRALDRAGRIRRARERAERRAQDRRDRRQRREDYNRNRADRERARRDRARERRREQDRRREEQRRRRRERRDRRRARGTPADGAYIVDVTDPEHPIVGGGGTGIGGKEDAFRRAFEEDERRRNEAQARFGDWNLANAQLPLFGATGGPTNLEAHTHVLTLSHNAHARLLNGLMGGPGYYSGNLGQRERNRPGVPVIGSDLGQHVTAYPGEALTVAADPIRIAAILEAQEGGRVQATGSAVEVARERRGAGAVTDERALIGLDNDGSDEDQIRDAGRNSWLDGLGGWGTTGVAIYGFPDERRRRLFTVGRVNDRKNAEIGTSADAQGGEDYILVDGEDGELTTRRDVNVTAAQDGTSSDVNVTDGGAVTLYPTGTGLGDLSDPLRSGTRIRGFPGGFILSDPSGAAQEGFIGGNVTLVNEEDPLGSKLTCDVIDPYLLMMEQVPVGSPPSQLDGSTRGFWVGDDDEAYYWDGTTHRPWGSGGVTNLDDLADVDVAGASTVSTFLTYDGAGTWVDSNLPLLWSIAGLSLAGHAGDVLAVDGTEVGFELVAGGGGAGAGAVRTIRFVLGTATASSVTEIPADARVLSARLEITTPYSNGTTIALGRTGSTSLLMATTDNDATIAQAYLLDLDAAWGGAALAVLATIAGGPVAGAAVVVVTYTEPEA